MTKHCAPLPTVGVLLAGGAAKRLGGGDKSLRAIAGMTLLERTVYRLAPQCHSLWLNANGDATRFATFGLDVAPDDIPGNPGPLGGILAALDRLALRGDTAWLLSVPTDCPFLPANLVERLHEARGDAKIVLASSNGQTHPIIALWHASLRADLYHALVGEDVRKAGAFVARHPHAIVEWPAVPVDPFFNVNTPEDFSEAERLAAAHPTA